MNGITLDDRLLSAAEYVRQGAILADIGTDHAFLPIFLLESGRISRAILADINEGPLASARQNCVARGVIDRVELHLTDGAALLGGLGITDYTICGMGGELIARIVESAPHLMTEGVRLILQPMSRQGALRKALIRLGFAITSESYTEVDGKHYVTMLAEYEGTPRLPDYIECELGAPREIKNREAYLSYLLAKERSLTRQLQGKEKSGIVDGELVSLIGAVREKIKSTKE